MSPAYIALGSNIEPEENLRRALRLLRRRVQLDAISTVWRTEPIGSQPQPHFYNAVVKIHTNIRPLDLKIKVLRRIESQLGRMRSVDKYAPRTIDLDLLLYSHRVINRPELVVPDPHIGQRAFLARGLLELAPDLYPVGWFQPLAMVAAGLPATGMEPLPQYTRELRDELSRRL